MSALLWIGKRSPKKRAPERTQKTLSKSFDLTAVSPQALALELKTSKSLQFDDQHFRRAKFFYVQVRWLR